MIKYKGGDDMRYAKKMDNLTTCDGCGNDCHNLSGFCQDCQSPDW